MAERALTDQDVQEWLEAITDALLALDAMDVVVAGNNNDEAATKAAFERLRALRARQRGD